MSNHLSSAKKGLNLINNEKKKLWKIFKYATAQKIMWTRCPAIKQTAENNGSLDIKGYKNNYIENPPNTR